MIKRYSFLQIIYDLYIPFAIIADLEGENRGTYLFIGQLLNLLILWNKMYGLPSYNLKVQKFEIGCIWLRIFAFLAIFVDDLSTAKDSVIEENLLILCGIVVCIFATIKFMENLDHKMLCLEVKDIRELSDLHRLLIVLINALNNIKDSGAEHMMIQGFLRLNYSRLKLQTPSIELLVTTSYEGIQNGFMEDEGNTHHLVDYFRFLEELIEVELQRFGQDPDLQLLLCQIQFHKLKKPWTSLHHLVKINELKNQSSDINYGCYCFSKLIENEFRNNEESKLSNNRDFIQTSEILQFEKIFDSFIAKIMSGTKH